MSRCIHQMHQRSGVVDPAQVYSKTCNALGKGSLTPKTTTTTAFRWCIWWMHLHIAETPPAGAARSGEDSNRCGKNQRRQPRITTTRVHDENNKNKVGSTSPSSTGKPRGSNSDSPSAPRLPIGK